MSGYSDTLSFIVIALTILEGTHVCSAKGALGPIKKQRGFFVVDQVFSMVSLSCAMFIETQDIIYQKVPKIVLFHSRTDCWLWQE